LKYHVKPWKEPPEKQPAAAIKTEINDDNCFDRKEMMDALTFENPVVVALESQCFLLKF